MTRLPSNLSTDEAERLCFMQFAPGSLGRRLFGIAEEAAEEEVEQVQEQLDEANAEIEELNGKLSEAEEQLALSEMAVEQLQDQLREAEANIDANAGLEELDK